MRVNAVSAAYRRWLNIIHNSRNKPVAARLVFIAVSACITAHYIRLFAWCLLTSALLTCLIRTEWGMLHFTALLLPWFAEKIIYHHRTSNALTKVRNRIAFLHKIEHSTAE